VASAGVRDLLQPPVFDIVWPGKGLPEPVAGGPPRTASPDPPFFVGENAVRAACKLAQNARQAGPPLGAVGGAPQADQLLG
jgi:hypothetical protein